MPLSDLIQQRPVIVIATIEYVATAPAGDNPEDRRYDVGFLRVTDVLKSDRPEIEVGTILPLLMPAHSNRTLISTDLAYATGTTGIWLLTPASNGGWRADHPSDLQALEAGDDIRQHIAEQATE